MKLPAIGRFASATELAMFGATAAAMVVIPLITGGRYVPTVMASIVLFFILGALFDFMLGYLKIVNFGIAGFLCAGAYGSALSVLYLGVSPWLGLAIGGIASLVLGVVTGALTLRLRGIYVGLTTLFVMESLRYTILSGREFTRGASGLIVDPFTPLLGLTFSRRDPITYYYLLLALAGAVYVCLHVIVRSRIGLIFKAIRDDELGAGVLGIEVVRYKLLNFSIATFFVGVFGAFYAHYIGILVPTTQEFGVLRTVEILVIAYIGGRGTLWGSFLGAILLVGLQEVFRDFAEWRLIIYGAALVAIIMLFPRGLAGGVLQIMERIRSLRPLPNVPRQHNRNATE